MTIRNTTSLPTSLHRREELRKYLLVKLCATLLNKIAPNKLKNAGISSLSPWRGIRGRGGNADNHNIFLIEDFSFCNQKWQILYFLIKKWHFFFHFLSFFKNAIATFCYCLKNNYLYALKNCKIFTI